MPSDNLTPIEGATLVVLMAENRDIPNPELVKDFGINLSPASRQKLERLGYIKAPKTKVQGTGRAVFTFTLMDAGWARCREPFDFGSSGARFTGAALSSLLAAVQQDQKRTHRSPAMMFGFVETSTPTVTEVVAAPADVQEQIRLAYKQFTAEPGAWVNIADIRDALSSVGRDDMDAALRELEQQRDVNIVPQANEKALSERTRRAAVIIGRQQKHFIAIGV
jgi:hypothetical protein